MPRNAAGQYTLPVGNPVITDTLIESDGWANPTMDDLGAEIEDSLSRDGKGAMRAALGIVDGSEANPGLRYIGETGSGLYRESDGRWWLVVKGVQKILVSELVGVIIDDVLTVNQDLIVEGDLFVNGAGGLTVAPLKVIGVDDELQVLIQGGPGQSENYVLIQDESAVEIYRMEEDGRPVWSGTQITPGSGHEYHFENGDDQLARVKTGGATGGGEIRIDDIISGPGGADDHKARYTHGGQSAADEAEVSLLEQTGGGNAPGLAWETSQVGDFNRAFVKRLSGAQTANLHEWRDEVGAVMAAIDKDGNFIGGPGGSGDGGQTPDNTGNVPVGAILMWPLSPPSLGVEWLVCDGTSYTTAGFPALFAYLGYTYGGAGANFNVPDWRGYFPRAQDAGAGRDPDAGTRTARPDGTGGDNPGTTQGDDVGAGYDAHTHLYLGVTGGGLSGGGGFGGGMVATSSASGGGGGTETRPINIGFVAAIKAV